MNLVDHEYAWAGDIRAILFDLDGTLRHSQPTFAQAFLDIVADLGLARTHDGCHRVNRWLHYYWARSPELISDWPTFFAAPDQFWANHARLLLLVLGVAEDEAASLGSLAAERMRATFRPEDRLFADVPQTLAQVQSAGYRLGVVSNRRSSYEEQLLTLGLSDYFEFSLFAGDLQRWKPQPALFHIALERLGADASEVIYVGDNYYADVIGARNAGLQPVLFDAEKLYPEADCPVIVRRSALLEIVPLPEP